MRKFSVGDRVSQAQYGDGTVTGANEYHIRIDFDEHGPRTFSTSKASLTPSTSEAPAKAKPRRKRAAPAAKAAKAAQPEVS